MSRDRWRQGQCAAMVLIAGCGRLGFERTDAFDASDASDASDAAALCVPTGHDEDLDGVDDACDVCPHLAGDQADQDGDRVGDACDPEPSLARQHIVLFDPFVDVAAWNAINGTYVANDQVVMDSTLDFRILRRPYTRAHDLFVVHGTTANAGSGPALFAIMATNAAGGRYYCEMFDTGVKSALQYSYTFDGTSYTTQGSQPQVQRVVGGSGDLTYELAASTATCTSSWHGEASTSNAVLPTFIVDSIELYAENLAVRFDYFLQIRTDD